MKYCLFKLGFTSPVHFGSGAMAHSLDTGEMTCHADTLFSALCHTASVLGGESKVEWLVRLVQQDALRLSDCMPYQDETLYLPRPCWQPMKQLDLPSGDRKILKKAEWIPVDEMESCLSALRGEGTYNWANAGNKSKFGTTVEMTKAAVPDREDAVPYTVGLFQFFENCGLYFILQYEQEDDAAQIEQLVQALGYSGIGGKISAGYGKFEVADTAYFSCAEDTYDEATAWLYQHFNCANSKHWMLLSAALPADAELESVIPSACFQVVRRGGFTHPRGKNAELLKKQTQYFLSSGSIIAQPFSGDLFDVGFSPDHPIYRYSKPILLGVNL